MVKKRDHLDLVSNPAVKQLVQTLPRSRIVPTGKLLSYISAAEETFNVHFSRKNESDFQTTWLAGLIERFEESKASCFIIVTAWEFHDILRYGLLNLEKLRNVKLVVIPGIFDDNREEFEEFDLYTIENTPMPKLGQAAGIVIPLRLERDELSDSQVRDVKQTIATTLQNNMIPFIQIHEGNDSSMRLKTTASVFCQRLNAVLRKLALSRVKNNIVFILDVLWPASPIKVQTIAKHNINAIPQVLKNRCQIIFNLTGTQPTPNSKQLEQIIDCLDKRWKALAFTRPLMFIKTPGSQIMQNMQRAVAQAYEHYQQTIGK